MKPNLTIKGWNDPWALTKDGHIKSWSDARRKDGRERGGGSKGGHCWVGGDIDGKE